MAAKSFILTIGGHRWRTLAVVRDALTEAGRRYAINFSR